MAIYQINPNNKYNNATASIKSVTAGLQPGSPGTKQPANQFQGDYTQSCNYLPSIVGSTKVTNCSEHISHFGDDLTFLGYTGRVFGPVATEEEPNDVPCGDTPCIGTLPTVSFDAGSQGFQDLFRSLNWNDPTTLKRAPFSGPVVQTGNTFVASFGNIRAACAPNICGQVSIHGTVQPFDGGTITNPSQCNDRIRFVGSVTMKVAPFCRELNSGEWATGIKVTIESEMCFDHPTGVNRVLQFGKVKKDPDTGIWLDDPLVIMNTKRYNIDHPNDPYPDINCFKGRVFRRDIQLTNLVEDEIPILMTISLNKKARSTTIVRP